MRYGLSFRDVEELLAERGIVVDHVTVHGWVQRFTPMFIDAARPCRRSAGDRWFVDETYVKVGSRWCYLYRAVDQFGQVIDVYLSARRYARAARPFFDSAVAVTRTEPVEIVTDRAHAYLRVIEDRVPAVWHHVERYANHPVECDRGRLKARLGRCAASTLTLRSGGYGRARIRAEPAPRPLRARSGRAGESTRHLSVR